MTAEVSQFPPMMAVFETGESRGEVVFDQISADEGDIIGKGSDNLYDYSLTPMEDGVTGTLFVRNKKTHKVRAIPIEQLLEVQRNCRIHKNEEDENAGIDGLINNFGTRKSQLIRSRLHSGGK